MEKHGKLSQNDVDEADTAVVCDKREIMIWIFGEIAKNPNRQTALVTERSAVLLIFLWMEQFSLLLNSFSTFGN